MKKHKWIVYLLWIIFTEAVGAISGGLTGEGTQIYAEMITKPPLSPPGIVFPIVWGILYALMGIGAARVYLSESCAGRKKALFLYFLQLAFNFFWSTLLV